MSGELPTFCETRKVKARKDHKCTSCGETIGKGCLYSSIKGVWDGEWASYRQCVNCEKISINFRLMDKELLYEDAPTLDCGGISDWLRHFLCRGWSGEIAAKEISNLFDVPLCYARRRIGIDSLCATAKGDPTDV